MTTTIEYGLMVDWDEQGTEFIPAKDAHHAEEMARKLYSHRPTWTVGREVSEWRYVTVETAALTSVVAG